MRETLTMADKAFRLQAMSFRERQTEKGATSRIAEFFASNKFLTTVFILCLATLATVYRPDSNGINLEGYTNGLEFQIRSRALRRASWDTFVDTSKPSRRRNPFSSRPRRAFVSSLHTTDYFPLSLAMGYSLSQTNDIAAQNAEMVLFVRKAANISTSALDKLQKVGWKLRIEDDIVLKKNINIEEISPGHRWNLNKLRFWSWTEYDQILFLDSDTLVKGDLSDIWKTPGSTYSARINLTIVIAAAPDAWTHTTRDANFNSGVLLLRPSLIEYDLLLRGVSTPGMHLPHEGDQPFLNRFYEYRHFGLPHMYNLNLVLYQWYPVVWKFLWPKAKVVHFTARKPGPPARWCVVDCPQRDVFEWYADVFTEMLEYYG